MLLLAIESRIMAIEFYPHPILLLPILPRTFARPVLFEVLTLYQRLGDRLEESVECFNDFAQICGCASDFSLTQEGRPLFLFVGAVCKVCAECSGVKY